MMTYKTQAIAKQMATKFGKKFDTTYEVREVEGGYGLFDLKIEAEQKAKAASAAKAPKEKKQTRSAPVPNTDVYGSEEAERARLLRDTKRYFEENYEFDGNDIVVETMDDADLVGYIGKSKKLLGAVMNVRYFGGVKAIHEARQEAKAGAY